MALNYSLKYKRFDQLLSEVLIDFKSFTLDSLIEPQELIKVARRVTYDLGLRIYQPKETVLEVCHGKVKLPYDFYIFNIGLLCGEFTVDTALPQGTHIEERPYVSYREIPATVNICAPAVMCDTCNLIPADGGCGCNKTCTPPPVSDYNPAMPYGDYCIKPRVFMNCKGDAYELVQIVKTETMRYKQLYPLTLVGNDPSIVANCPNKRYQGTHQIWIKDGWLYANFQSGRVYISYEGMLEDAEGNLLVADHEYLNEYYEYALKERLLENLLMNGEDVERRLDRISVKLKTAKTIAKNFVNTPNFSEIQDVWSANRQFQMNKYYNLVAPMVDPHYNMYPFSPSLGPTR